MKILPVHIILVSMLVIFSTAAYSQSATAKIDSTTLIIGDQAHLELQVTVPKGSQLSWPVFADTLVNHVEILRKSGLDTVSGNAGEYTLRQELLLTSFDSGYYAIPPIRFSYNFKGDTTNYYIETDPVYIYVNTVATDDKQDIKPIKPPLKAPVTLKEVLAWAGIILLIAAVVFAVYYFLIRKKKKEPVTVTRLQPGLPPYEAALQAFESLRQKKLWQAGRVKDYYSEMTEIVREYIELRFSIRALEMTTDEISAALRKTDVNKEVQGKLQSTLSLADLVKFAKEQPLPAENDLSLNQCVDFVKETRPLMRTEAEQPAATLSNPSKPE